MVEGYLYRLWYSGQPLVCNLCAVQGHSSANCPNKDKCRKCGKTGQFARNCTFDRSAGDCGFLPCSHLCSLRRPVSLVILLTFSFLRITSSIYYRVQDLGHVSGDSSEAESNHSASKRVGKGKDSSAKRSNSAPSPTFNICFTNSQEFNSLVANSAKLDGITSKGNNESTTVRNISKERSNVINDNISANSTCLLYTSPSPRD